MYFVDFYCNLHGFKYKINCKCLVARIMLSSLQLGLIVILLLFLLSQITAILHVVSSWIRWSKDIKHLYSLPSPPRRWLWGNALEVSITNSYLTY